MDQNKGRLRTAAIVAAFAAMAGAAMVKTSFEAGAMADAACRIVTGHAGICVSAARTSGAARTAQPTVTYMRDIRTGLTFETAAS